MKNTSAVRLIALALCLLLPTVATAECVRVDGAPDKRLCDLSTLTMLKTDIITAEHDRDVNAARFAEAAAQLAAKDERVKALETAVQSPPFPWRETLIGAGAGVVATLLLVGIVAVAK